MKFNALLIGLGQIGLGYDLYDRSNNKVLTHTKALTLHKHFQLIAAVDSNKNNRSSFSLNYALPAFESLQDLNVDESIDLVIIATPTSTHLRIIEDIINKISPKLIVCEKPFTCSSDEARSAIDLCEKANCKLLVNYIRRTDPGALRCKSILKSERLGKVEKGVVWYSKGLQHNGSHFLNLLENWLGIANLRSVISSTVFNGQEDYSVDALFTFQNTPIYFLSRKEENFSYYSMELDCQKGRLIYDDGGFNISLRIASPDTNFPDYVKLPEQSELIDNDLIRYQSHALDDWYNCLCGRDFNSCTATEALNTHLLVKSVLTSNNP